MIDHKAIAARRLKELQVLRDRLDRLGDRVEDTVARELGLVLHANCISVSDAAMQKIIGDVASRVRVALTGGGK